MKLQVQEHIKLFSIKITKVPSMGLLDSCNMLNHKIEMLL